MLRLCGRSWSRRLSATKIAVAHEISQRLLPNEVGRDSPALPLIAGATKLRLLAQLGVRMCASLAFSSPARAGEMVEAAVLVPLFRRQDGDLRLILVRRAAHGRHGGQLAFPGGKRDPADPSLVATMLRETQEEIGLDAEAIEILEHLPPVETTTSGFRIWPFLGRVRPPAQWGWQISEIEEVMEVSVSTLAAVDEGEREQSLGSQEARQGPSYRIGPDRLWGVSYRILQPLMPRLLTGEWRI